MKTITASSLIVPENHTGNTVSDIIADYATKCISGNDARMLLLKCGKRNVFTEYSKTKKAGSKNCFPIEELTINGMVDFLISYYEPSFMAKHGVLCDKSVKPKKARKAGKSKKCDLVVVHSKDVTDIITCMAVDMFVEMRSLHTRYKESKESWDGITYFIKEGWIASGIEGRNIEAVYIKALKNPFGFRFSVHGVVLTLCVWVEADKHRMSVYNADNKRCVYF